MNRAPGRSERLGRCPELCTCAFPLHGAPSGPSPLRGDTSPEQAQAAARSRSILRVLALASAVSGPLSPALSAALGLGCVPSPLGVALSRPWALAAQFTLKSWLWVPHLQSPGAGLAPRGRRPVRTQHRVAGPRSIFR